MGAKTEAIKKIMMSRRTMMTWNLMEKSKLCSTALLQLQRKHLQALQQLHFLDVARIALTFERSSSIKVKPQKFWEEDCQLAVESVFRHRFRMSRNIFNKLCEQLSGLQQRFANISKNITLQKGIAIALYALGSTEEYRKIGKMFGVKKAAVVKIILRFCEEVWKILAPIYLNNFPLQKEKVQALIDEFDSLGFPQCMGALNSCRIAIKSSGDSSAKDSVVLLTLVDANCGSPGYCNDSQVYQESSLRQYLDQCSLLLELQKNIADVDVPALIIGDSDFELSEKLMTPYPANMRQTQQQKLFNHVLSKSLETAKNAILQLKARFKRIEKGINSTKVNSNAIILTCCALHNFLNENNDVVNEEWLNALQTTESERAYAERNIVVAAHLNNGAKAIRLAIASYLSGNDVSDDYEELDDKSEAGCFKDAEETGDSSNDKNDEVLGDFDNGSLIIDELLSE